MPTYRSGKMRGKDGMLWTSTSSSTVNHPTRRAGDPWFRRFITTTTHQIGRSPANAVDGNTKNSKLGDVMLVTCIFIFHNGQRPRALVSLADPCYCAYLI